MTDRTNRVTCRDDVAARTTPPEPRPAVEFLSSIQQHPCVQGLVALAERVIADLEETCDCGDHVQAVREYRDALEALRA